jgi:Ca2+-binding RTX toxin-like protein
MPSTPWQRFGSSHSTHSHRRTRRLSLESLEDRRLLSLSTGLIGYWPFDGDANDHSGSGYNLSLFGGVGFASGLLGQALDLHNNTAQYAQRPTSDAAFNFGANDFTVQIWVNYNNHVHEETLIEKFTGAGGPGWTLTSLPDHYQLYTASVTGPVDTPSGTITNGVWHQVIGRRSGSTFSVCIDGVPRATLTASGTIPDSSLPLLVGKRDDQSGQVFPVDGRLDEAAIWQRALSDAEVAALWDNGAGRSPLDTGAGVTAVVVGTTLQVTGDSQGQAITLRLKAGDPSTLEVDVGNDGTADFSFARASFNTIVLNGGGGNDALRIDESNGVFSDTQHTTILGGAGNDTVTGGSAGESFDLGTGTDTLIGPDASNAWVLTGAGAGTLDGMPFTGVENLRGGAQSDVFSFHPSGAVSGTVNGGAGSADRLDYSSYGSAVTVNLQTKTAPGMAHFAAIEALTGSSGSDTLVGANAASTWQVLSNNGGKVGSYSFSSFENLTGGGGNDTFKLSAGQGVLGTLNGGGGTNTLSYAAYGAAQPVSVDLSAGTATNLGGILNIENATGGAGNDTLTGNAGDNVLLGGAGNDLLSGGAGGNDVLVGGSGDDTLLGGPGRSLLIGGGGLDHLTGGSDDDLLIAGTTNYDTNTAALLAVLSEWKRTDADYATRILHLRNGGGNNGTFVLTSSTVHNDTAADVLTGGAGQDWFWAHLSEITDRDPSEQVN